MNRVEFMEHFIKLGIIKEFAAKMVLLENKHLTPLDKGEQSIMCIANVEGHEDIKKFFLTGMRYLNEIERTIEIYSVMGILSLLNDGRIIITEYDMQ